MNALKVSQSRFAVLKIEDDDISEPTSPSKGNQKIVKKSSSNQGNNTSGTSVSNKTKKKKRSNSDGANNASSGSASATSKSKPKSNEKSKVAAKQQWEEWKEKDSKFVSEAFEQDLQEALLQSKLEFEERKKQVLDHKSSGGHNSSSNEDKKKKSKKKDKPASMSLEEFHNMNGSEDPTSQTVMPSKDVPPPLPANEKDFFGELEKDVERILQREHIKDSGRAIDVEGGDKLLCLQHEKEIKEKDEQVKELTNQVEKLAADLKLVKTRNKKLCGILAQAEMKEKAEILVQVDHMTQIKDELTQQVTELHAALEQEKSKVHALQLELKRYQESKKETRESK